MQKPNRTLLARNSLLPYQQYRPPILDMIMEIKSHFLFMSASLAAQQQR